MPIINITLVEGREDEKIKEYIKKVVEVTHEGLDAPYEAIRVFVNEVPPNRFAVGQKLKSE
ncbi:2-hydroxymuconate tautomerase [Bacillus sp. Marseille-P3661]|uniref:2-hydroxymuconate tautomerase n=1 Tax=Bacillus sp. Marseille-P3661 TaxID=1936234 RepID=UPI000C8254E6|nr:2-hydroxymuconate tautomerase [Bacillus sp. Marseille-P3661]